MSNDITGVYFSGLLLESPLRALQRADIEGVRNFSFVKVVHGTNWEHFVFRSEKPLRLEDGTGPCEYPIICRRSGSRVLMLSVAREIVEHLVKNDFEQAFSPQLRRVSIAVDDLVKGIARRPTLYALSFAHAKVPAFGNSLRGVFYYGDDLAEASLFRDQIDLMVFFTCGLKEAAGGAEIVRLGGDGTVSFFMSTHKVLEVEKALGFLREEGYLTSEIWAA
jgi:hypothetical protein